MDYEMEKLKEEYRNLKALWDKLTTEWEKPSDFEDLYRVYPLLTATAAIVRKYIYWNQGLNFSVRVIIPSLENTKNASEYLYYDEKAFFNGEEKNISLSEVASLFLHQREFCYMDDRKSDGKMTNAVKIYLYTRTDRLCKSCSLANNGEYRGNGKDYRKTKSFVSYSDCECGYYIRINSYLSSVDKVIRAQSARQK